MTAPGDPDSDAKLYERLTQLREEVRLKAHLLQADMRDELACLERDWQQLNRELHPVKDATRKSLDNIGAATKLLIDETLGGYKRIVSSLERK